MMQIVCFTGNHSSLRIQEIGHLPYLIRNQSFINHTIQNFCHALIERQAAKPFPFFFRIVRKVQRQVQSPVLSPAAGENMLNGNRILDISSGFIQHDPSLQGHCSRKYP